jgi:hypothetical protein
MSRSFASYVRDRKGSFAISSWAGRGPDRRFKPTYDRSAEMNVVARIWTLASGGVCQRDDGFNEARRSTFIGHVNPDGPDMALPGPRKSCAMPMCWPLSPLECDWSP